MAMSLFRSSKKSPSEITKLLKEAIMAIELNDMKKFHTVVKAQEEISKQINNMKSILFSQSDNEIPNELVVSMCKEILDQNIISMLIHFLAKLDFESKKEFVLLLGNLLRKPLPNKNLFVDHILEQKDLIPTIIDGYTNPEISLNIGMILREFAKYSKLCMAILYSEDFAKFFQFINDSSFDIGSDAYLTFKELVTRFKELVAKYLEENYDFFFTSYNQLLNSENYVTKRQSIKLLGELLVERFNYNVLIRYVSNNENLKLIMTLMKDKSSTVQFEAFHVFKIFVVNPNRSPSVTDILVRNKQLLVQYLSTFHNDRKDDEQFIDEKQYVIKQIKELKESTA